MKQYEARTWRPAALGPLVIHASAHKPTADDLEDFTRALAKAGLDAANLPRGRVVGVVDVVKVVPGSDSMRTVALKHRKLCGVFGDTSEVFLWRLAHPQAIADAPPLLGALNIWRLPDDVVRFVKRAVGTPEEYRNTQP